jgi:Mrp family chromosome partitioning ATPase
MNAEVKKSFLVKGNDFSDIKKIIGVVSGKGGVGKSTVTCALARQLKKMGYKTGILDADITGPSIPRMMGVEERCEESEMGIMPPESTDGIKIMSMNLLLQNEDDAVIWRGPVIANFVKQFYSDVCWGELDFLLVDMPPGTGDVPLTVFQSIPVDGIVLVTSPQSLVSMIVKKAYNMAQKMDIPVLGIIENYSYYKCPDCGRIEKIYGESHIDEEALAIDVPVLAKLPINPALAAAADEGKYFEFSEPIDVSPIVKNLFDVVLFDLDGTLTDPKQGITSCVQYALASIGIDEPDLDELEDFIGPPLKEHFMERYSLDEKTALECVRKYRERYNPIGVYENKKYDGIDEVLRTLKERGMKLAVASSKPAVLVDTVLEHFDLIKYFDVIAGSELDGTRTRKSDVIRYAFLTIIETRLCGEVTSTIPSTGID